MNAIRTLTMVVCLSALAGTAFGQNAGDRPMPLQVGDKAPPVVATWLGRAQGKDPSKPDGKTKAYIVAFWTTWCPACPDAVPYLNLIHKDFARQGVVVMGITPEPEAIVRPFLEKPPRMNYAVGADRNGITSKGYGGGVPGQDFPIPHAFVVDGKGTVAWSGHPLQKDDPMIDAVRKLVSSRPR